MHWIIRMIIVHRRVCSLLLTSLLSLLMITASPVRQMEIVRFLSLTVFFPLQTALSQTTRIKNIFAENHHLKSEVVRLTTIVSHLKENSVENKQLRNLLNLSNDFTYDLLPVRVIAKDPALSYKSIVVSSGYNDTVKKFMPCIGEKGVAGKVVRVMHQISQVQLLKDPSNRTGVLFSRSRAVGILETEDGNDFFVDCRNHESIEKGDTVVTSGLGGIYPRGLNVGMVKDVEKIRDPLFKRVHITLFMDFDHLEELFILRMSPQWSAFREELDSIEFNDD